MERALIIGASGWGREVLSKCVAMPGMARIG